MYLCLFLYQLFNSFWNFVQNMFCSFWPVFKEGLHSEMIFFNEQLFSHPDHFYFPLKLLLCLPWNTEVEKVKTLSGIRGLRPNTFCQMDYLKSVQNAYLWLSNGKSSVYFGSHQPRLGQIIIYLYLVFYVCRSQLSTQRKSPKTFCQMQILSGI